MGSIIIAGVIGFVLGAAIAWAVALSRKSAPVVGDGGAAVLRDELNASKSDNQRLQSALMLAQSNASSAEASRVAAEKNLEEQRALLDLADKRMREAFDSAANSALRTSNSQFLQMAEQNFKTLREQASGDLEARKQSVEQLVSPIRESLEKLNKETQELEKKRAEESGKIGRELEQLSLTHKELQSATINLLHALKSPKIRGRWGELALKNLVEMAGMSSHCDFTEQTTLQGAENKMRPDMIVRLPGGRHVPVDSKVPLEAFMNAMEAVDDIQRAAQIKLHAAHTRNHVKALSEKSYMDYVEDAEFVVMFIPNDTFLAVAAEEDTGLIQFGIERKVLIATPSTLIALLKAISYGWRQAIFTENAKQVQSLSVELVERIVTFSNYFTEVGGKLTGAVDAYNKAIKSWDGRLIPHTEKLKELGAGATKEMPDLEPINNLPLLLREKTQKQ